VTKNSVLIFGSSVYHWLLTVRRMKPTRLSEIGFVRR
jgi:hypothetical protein